MGIQLTGAGYINRQRSVGAVSPSIDAPTTTALLGTIAAIVESNPSSAPASTVGSAVVPDVSGINKMVLGTYGLSPYQLEQAGILKPGSSPLVNSLIAGGTKPQKALQDKFFTGRYGVNNFQSLLLNQNAQAHAAAINLKVSQTQLQQSGMITGKEAPSQIAGLVLSGTTIGVPNTINMVKTLNSVQVPVNNINPTLTLAPGGFGTQAPNFYNYTYIGDPTSQASLGTAFNNAVVNTGNTLAKGAAGALMGGVNQKITSGLQHALGNQVGGVVGRAVTGALTNAVGQGVQSLVQSGLQSLGFNVAQNAVGAGISGISGAIGGGLGGIATAGINQLTGGALTSLTQSVSGGLTSALGNQIGGALGNAFSGAINSVAGAALGAGLQALGVGNLIGGLFGGGGPSLGALQSSLRSLSTVPSYANLRSSNQGTAATAFQAIRQSMPTLQVGVPNNLTQIAVNTAVLTLAASIGKNSGSVGAILQASATNTLRSIGSQIATNLGRAAGSAVRTAGQDILKGLVNDFKTSQASSAAAKESQQLADWLTTQTQCTQPLEDLLKTDELANMAVKLNDEVNAGVDAAIATDEARASGISTLVAGQNAVNNVQDLNNTYNPQTDVSSSVVDLGNTVVDRPPTAITTTPEGFDANGNPFGSINVPPLGPSGSPMTQLSDGSWVDQNDPNAWNDGTQSTQADINNGSQYDTTGSDPTDQATADQSPSIFTKIFSSIGSALGGGSGGGGGGGSGGGGTATGGIVQPQVAINTIARDTINFAVLRMLGNRIPAPTLYGGSFKLPTKPATAAQIASAQTNIQTNSNNLISVNAQVTDAYNNLQNAINNYPAGDPRIIQARITYQSLLGNRKLDSNSLPPELSIPRPIG